MCIISSMYMDPRLGWHVHHLAYVHGSSFGVACASSRLCTWILVGGGDYIVLLMHIAIMSSVYMAS